MSNHKPENRIKEIAVATMPDDEKVAAILEQLDSPMQQHLVIDFAEHLISILDEDVDDMTVFNQAITRTRQFLAGEIPISQVEEIRRSLFDERYHETMYSKPHVLHYPAWAMINTLSFCCYDELAAAKFLHPNAKSTTKEVIDKIPFAFASYKTGINPREYDSSNSFRPLPDDEETRLQEAKSAEYDWQLKHTLVILHLI
jgi:hypothetical protein